MKSQTPFTFSFPLNNKVVRDLKIVTEHIGDLEVSGVAYKDNRVSTLEEGRYGADIDSIKWNGTEVIEMVKAGLFNGAFEEIEQAAQQHAGYLFLEQSFAVYKLTM